MIRMIPEAQIGPIRITDFSSSTRWTVLSFHRFGFCNSSPIFTLSSSVTIAALSRNLRRHHSVVVSFILMDILQSCKNTSNLHSLVTTINHIGSFSTLHLLSIKTLLHLHFSFIYFELHYNFTYLTLLPLKKCLMIKLMNPFSFVSIRSLKL